MRETIKDPKPGDPVAYHNGRDADPVKRTITKVTATQVEVEGQRFMRSTGRIFGRNTYTYEHIEPWTTEVEQRIAKRLRLVALKERRDAVLARLRKVTSPVEWMPNRSTTFKPSDPRYQSQVPRSWTSRQLDAVEVLAGELERIVAETVEMLDALMPGAPAEPASPVLEPYT